MTKFDAIFAVLQATGVRYVVVGGVALQALTDSGFKPNIPVKIPDFADPITREQWIRDKGMTVFQMYNDQTRMTVDIKMLEKRREYLDEAGDSQR